jgi:fibronectin-binding autotransporter adhesin
MKLSPRSTFTLAAAVAGAATAASANTIQKDSTGLQLTSTTSWVGGVAPTSADTALFDNLANASSSSSPFTVPSGNPTWGAIQITSVSAPLFISVGTGTWTIGGNSAATTVIDMSNAAQDLTIDGSTAARTLRLSNAAGSYAITVAPNRTFTLGSNMTLTDQSGNRTLTLGGGGNFAINGAIANGGGVVHLNLNDANGIATLAGANTYSGLTGITAGTLYLNGSHTGAGNYTVSSGATLAGTGTVTFTGAKTAAINGTIAPGSAASPIGTFSFAQSGGTADVTLAGNANFDLDLAANTADKLLVGNNLAYGGALNITATGASATPETFDLFDFTSESGTFSSINVTGLAAGQTYAFDPSTGILSIAASPTPEPASLALLTLGALALTRRHPRRT